MQIEKRIEDTELEVAQNEQLAEMWTDAPEVLTVAEQAQMDRWNRETAEYQKSQPKRKGPIVW